MNLARMNVSTKMTIANAYETLRNDASTPSITDWPIALPRKWVKLKLAVDSINLVMTHDTEKAQKYVHRFGFFILAEA